MGAIFFKLIKWLVSVTALIGGLCLLSMSSQMGSLAPLAFSIMCFGIVFWFSKSTYEASRRVMVATAILVLISGLLSYFVVFPFILYPYNGNLFISWVLSIYVLGIPTMIHIIKKG